MIMSAFEREILMGKLMEAVKMDWSDVQDELKKLLKDYEIPEEYSSHVISWIKENIKSKLEDSSNKEWLSEALTKLYIKLAYELLHVQ